MADDTNTAEREAAEQWLRDRYGAYRGHFAWRELEEAFLAGRASLAASAGSEPVAEIGSAAGDDAEFGQRAIYPLVGIDHFEYGTKLYTRPSPPGGMAGWKLVPVEPTPEMVSVAFDAVEIGSFPGFATGNDARSAIYRAMVDAAPPLPASEEKGASQ